MKKDFIFEIYKDTKTIFSFKEIALLLGETNSDTLKSKIHYYVKTGKLKALRKGIYAKPQYDKFELASHIYVPVYISLETVLQEQGIIFQRDDRIYAVSYTRRTLEIDNHTIVLRKIKNEILYNNAGIDDHNHVPLATKERAFLDALYLYKKVHFDNLRSIDRRKVLRLLNIYNNKTLTNKALNLLESC